MNHIVHFVVGGMLVALLAACIGVPAATSPTAAPATTSALPVTPNAASAQAASTTGFPRTLTDDEGRKVTFDKMPVRVIAMYNAGYGIVTTLGIRPIGQLANGEMIADPRYLPDAQSIPNLEGSDGNADLEKIAALKPDLVIGGDVELAQSLKDIAPIFIIKYPQSLKDVYEDLRTVAPIFDKQALAEERITAFEARVKAYQSKLPATRPTALIAGIHTPDEIAFNLGSGCEVLNLFSRCKWKAPTSNSNGTGTLETLLNYDPDVLILGNWDPVNGFEALFKELDKRPLWGELSAVKNKRVLQIPILTNPAPYSLVGATIMLDEFIPRIYPDIFPKVLTDEQVQPMLAK